MMQQKAKFAHSNSLNKSDCFHTEMNATSANLSKLKASIVL